LYFKSCISKAVLKAQFHDHSLMIAPLLITVAAEIRRIGYISFPPQSSVMIMVENDNTLNPETIHSES
jgi:hypothetical protein